MGIRANTSSPPSEKELTGLEKNCVAPRLTVRRGTALPHTLCPFPLQSTRRTIGKNILNKRTEK